MNKIQAKLDKSDYDIYDDFLNFQIDEYWLDEKLEEVYPGNMYKGLVPTLLFWMEKETERNIVWKRIMPTKGEMTICPILMCPDDCDFSCTIIVAEVENINNMIAWNRIGLDKTTEYEAIKVGSSVEWFDDIGPFEFSKSNYQKMLTEFECQLKLEEVDWKLRIEKLAKN